MMSLLPKHKGNQTWPNEPSPDRFWFSLVCLVFGLALSLDAPWGRAFYDYTPFTESLGRFYFSSIAEAIGIPRVSLSIFEFVSFALAGVGLFKVFPNLVHEPSRTIFWGLLLSVFLVFAAGFLSGILHGNSYALMLTQTRSLATLPLWLIIGASFLTTPFRSWIFLSVIAGATILKSLQGLWSYIYVWDSQRGSREYLIEHVTSSFIITTSVVIGRLIWLRSWKIPTKTFYFFMTNSVLIFVFIINDRRAAFIGLVMALGVIGLALSWQIYRRNLKSLAGILLVGVLYLGATWESTGSLGFPARTLKSLFDPSESSAGYRDVENANLLLAVANDPLTGLGFGKRFPVVFPLPDISFVYSEFDLVPHNTLLFVWSFAGPLGMTGIALFFSLAIASAIRIFRSPGATSTRLLGILGVFVLVQGLSYIYADIGLREVRLLAQIGAVAGLLVCLTSKHPKEGLL